jgi:hypothetical protein
MTHQVLVRVAEDVVLVGPILREIQFRLLKDGDEIAKEFDPILSLAQLVRVVEVGEVSAGKSAVRVDERLDHLRVDSPGIAASAISPASAKKTLPIGWESR